MGSRWSSRATPRPDVPASPGALRAGSCALAAQDVVARMTQSPTLTADGDGISLHWPARVAHVRSGSPENSPEAFRSGFASTFARVLSAPYRPSRGWHRSCHLREGFSSLISLALSRRRPGDGPSSEGACCRNGSALPPGKWKSPLMPRERNDPIRTRGRPGALRRRRADQADLPRVRQIRGKLNRKRDHDQDQRDSNVCACRCRHEPGARGESVFFGGRCR